MRNLPELTTSCGPVFFMLHTTTARAWNTAAKNSSKQWKQRFWFVTPIWFLAPLFDILFIQKVMIFKDVTPSGVKLFLYFKTTGPCLGACIAQKEHVFEKLFLSRTAAMAHGTHNQFRLTAHFFGEHFLAFIHQKRKKNTGESNHDDCGDFEYAWWGSPVCGGVEDPHAPNWQRQNSCYKRQHFKSGCCFPVGWKQPKSMDYNFAKSLSKALVMPTMSSENETFPPIARSSFCLPEICQNTDMDKDSEWNTKMKQVETTGDTPWTVPSGLRPDCDRLQNTRTHMYVRKLFCEVALEQTVVQAWRDLCFTHPYWCHLPPTSHQPRKDHSQTSPLICHPPPTDTADWHASPTDVPP